MCLTNHYISRNCGHHWLAIRQPCWPGYGFTYCGVFGDGVAREPSPEFEIMGLCPACATPGYYDRNLVRMVTNVRERCRWGIGPSRRDPGVECANTSSNHPDTYIGSVYPTEQSMWVFNKETELMELRKVTFVPGLYKVFDEILVSIENNCKSIPVEIHHKEKVYIPKLVFGYLLVGSNFDEQEERTVGGRNGYRAILCNIFSAEFMLECHAS
ncbi:hypothetical protein F4860DRAFT_511069 [Xylaria cubensis]|nr:hypothetical protein F4860DRAFT_511069 [Xylaria cubensis]